MEKQPFYHALDASEFKAQCLELIAEVAERGGSVVIFDGDEPVVEVTRYVEPPMPGYGVFKGIVQILGDIEGPMPVEWYTHPDVQTDDDWTIDGPMPASWFRSPDEGKPKQRRERDEPDKVDVSVLHRHKFLTVNLGEFTAQLDEIVAAVAESKDGKVVVFDDENALVQLTRFEENLAVSDRVGEEQTMTPTEIVFEVTETDAGGYNARAVGHSIFTQGHDWVDLKAMAEDAVLCNFDNIVVPPTIGLRFGTVSTEGITGI